MLSSPASPILRSSAAQGWVLVPRDSSAASIGCFPIKRFPCKIGRSADCDIRLSDPTISTQHAEITMLDEGLAARDLASRNGTFVNGRRINDCFPIGPGDLLQFGDMLLEVQHSVAAQCGATCMAGENEDLALALAQFNKLFDEGRLLAHFQPIVTAGDKQVVAYEALARSSLFGLNVPKTMFQAAERLCRAEELSRLMRRVAMATAESSEQHLFLNTHPGEIKDLPVLIKSLREIRRLRPTQPVTFEIHESAVLDMTAMKMIRLALDDLNLTLAYDDFGAGQARLVELVDARPDYLKFDMGLIRGIDRGPESKQRLTETLVRMTRELGIVPLAEGVETEMEAVVCEQLGFELLQGYRFGRPGKEMA